MQQHIPSEIRDTVIPCVKARTRFVA